MSLTEHVENCVAGLLPPEAAMIMPEEAHDVCGLWPSWVTARARESNERTLERRLRLQLTQGPGAGWSTLCLSRTAEVVPHLVRNDCRDDVSRPEVLPSRPANVTVVTTIVDGQVHALVLSTKPIAKGPTLPAPLPTPPATT